MSDRGAKARAIDALFIEDLASGRRDVPKQVRWRTYYSQQIDHTSIAKFTTIPATAYTRRYSVRYTSSLYALEIAERTAVAAARDTPRYFNACCVVSYPR